MLTLTQKQAVKAFIVANPGIFQTLNDQQSADYFNQPASPTFFVYRTEVPVGEVMLNGFDWTRVDNLSVGKARIWEWMTTAKKVNDEFVFDPSKLNIRNGINETWKGTAADLLVRDAVYAHCQRAATVAEKLLVSTGAGTTIDGNGTGPATMGFEGMLTAQDVVDSLNS